MPYRPGDRVGEYEVQRFLGRGAYGEVLQVCGPGTCMQIQALKVLHCDGPWHGGSASHTREAAFAEARLMQRLRHPHIVACENVSWCAAREEVQLVLEFMDGGDLRGLIEAQKASGHHFEVHFARRILAAIGGALDYVHSIGVLHRDVKPANVLLARHAQRIKLADFGIAKLLETSRHAKSVVGTPYYLSPEIIAGKAYAEASDAWSLGVVVYEVVALHRPFEAANQLALVHRICQETHPKLPDHAAPDIVHAVEGLLVKDEHCRISLRAALNVSDAVAALVAKMPYEPDHQVATSSLPITSTDRPAHDIRSVTVPGTANESDAQGSWYVTDALSAAQEALSNDIDDPEELVHALTMLEQEQALASYPDLQASSARQAVENELRLRIGALRLDAAAMLDDLLAVSTHEDSHLEAHVTEESEHSISIEPVFEENPFTLNESVAPSTHDDALESEVATVLEVASTLGLDTEPSEHRIACKRGMLSLRVIWGKVARFCMLPINVGFDSLVAEVSRRFGLSVGAVLPELSWREAGEMFKLNNQASWEECLQRRGLVAQPGRLELCVDTEDAPPVPSQLRAPQRRPYHASYRPGLFTWRLTEKPAIARRTFNRQRESFPRSPNGHRDVASRRQLPAATSETTVAHTPQVADPALAGADDARRSLHEAAVKLQSLFRGSRVRRSTLESQGDTETSEARGRSAQQAKGRAHNIQGYSRGFSVERKNASETTNHFFGQTNESLSAARLQSRHARRSQSRSKPLLTIEGRDLRDRRSMSPKMQTSPYNAKMTVVDFGAGSRLQVNGRSAPRR